jgi:hypothetical protein
LTSKVTSWVRNPVRKEYTPLCLAVNQCE